PYGAEAYRCSTLLVIMDKTILLLGRCGHGPRAFHPQVDDWIVACGSRSPEALRMVWWTRASGHVRLAVDHGLQAGRSLGASCRRVGARRRAAVCPRVVQPVGHPHDRGVDADGDRQSSLA